MHVVHALSTKEDLCETLYAQQYSTNFGVYYDIVDPTVRSTKKL